MSANDDLGITIPVNRPANFDELAATIKAPPAPRTAPSANVQQPAGANPDAPVPFVFGDEIARGGMGSILKAEDCKLGRTIAVKIMLSELDADEDQKQRFINEAYVLAKLEHPNVVPIHDIGRDSEGQLYYTMKLVKGRTLQAIINDLRNEAPEALKHYTLSHLLTIFRKVCDAMAFAHSQGIIHRDLKPENIMVGEFGEVLVMDWGLAKTIGQGDKEKGRQGDFGSDVPFSPSLLVPQSSQTLQGSVMGTPQYMSPEQAEGRIADMDARSDIFSLGGILYALLTLRPPIEGTTLDEVLQKVISGTITPLTSKGRTALLPSSQKGMARRQEYRRSESIPPALAAVTMKALTVAREKRYQNIAALSADIEAYQNGFATSAENAGAWRQFRLLVQRHKAASIGAVAVLLIGGTLGTKALVEGRRAERALAELKKSAPAFAAEADSLLLKGDVPAALTRLDTAMQLDVEDPRWPARRGQILDAALRFPEAATSYAQAAALDPKGPWSDARQTSEKIAAARQPDGSYSTALLQELYAQAIRENRTGDALLLATPLKLAAQDALPLWQAKVDAWLGKNAPRIKVEKDGRYSLNLERLGITDLTPLKGMPLNWLGLGYNKVSDLSPLVGMPLRGLNIERTNVSDLSPLAGMRLDNIWIPSSPVSDLSPLRGMPLDTFYGQTPTLTDISPLSESPLTKGAFFEGSRVSDLAPLAGKELTNLVLPDIPLKNLSVLRGMPLKQFHVRSEGHTAELVDIVMSLTQLEQLTMNPSVPDFERLRAHPTIKLIGHDFNKRELALAVTDYWRAYDERRAERQQYAAHQIYVSQRPDGTKRLEIKNPNTREIPPLDWTNVSVFVFLGTKISDLSPLRGTKMRAITIFKTPVSDLEPLRGHPVVKLAFMETAVTDVSPLLDCPNLEAVAVSRTVKNVEVLRKHPKLKHIGYTEGPGPDYLPETTAEEFWRIYDAKQAAGKK